MFGGATDKHKNTNKNTFVLFIDPFHLIEMTTFLIKFITRLPFESQCNFQENDIVLFLPEYFKCMQ